MGFVEASEQFSQPFNSVAFVGRARLCAHGGFGRVNFLLAVEPVVFELQRAHGVSPFGGVGRRAAFAIV